jgi:hypothetical protein
MPVAGRVLEAAVRAAETKRGGAPTAKLHSFEILKSTIRTAHGYSLPDVV